MLIVHPTLSNNLTKTKATFLVNSHGIRFRIMSYTLPKILGTRPRCKKKDATFNELWKIISLLTVCKTNDINGYNDP